MDGRPNHRNKAVLSNFSGVVWTNRRIFVYNICLITISDTVSDGATKRLILNIERAQHD